MPVTVQPVRPATIQAVTTMATSQSVRPATIQAVTTMAPGHTAMPATIQPVRPATVQVVTTIATGQPIMPVTTQAISTMVTGQQVMPATVQATTTMATSQPVRPSTVKAVRPPTVQAVTTMAIGQTVMPATVQPVRPANIQAVNTIATGQPVRPATAQVATAIATGQPVIPVTTQAVTTVATGQPVMPVSTQAVTTVATGQPVMPLTTQAVTTMATGQPVTPVTTQAVTTVATGQPARSAPIQAVTTIVTGKTVRSAPTQAVTTIVACQSTMSATTQAISLMAMGHPGTSGATQAVTHMAVGHPLESTNVQMLSTMTPSQSVKSATIPVVTTMTTGHSLRSATIQAVTAMTTGQPVRLRTMQAATTIAVGHPTKSSLHTNTNTNIAVRPGSQKAIATIEASHLAVTTTAISPAKRSVTQTSSLAIEQANTENKHPTLQGSGITVVTSSCGVTAVTTVTTRVITASISSTTAGNPHLRPSHQLGNISSIAVTTVQQTHPRPMVTATLVQPAQRITYTSHAFTPVVTPNGQGSAKTTTTNALPPGAVSSVKHNSTSLTQYQPVVNTSLNTLTKSQISPSKVERNTKPMETKNSPTLICVIGNNKDKEKSPKSDGKGVKCVSPILERFDVFDGESKQENAGQVNAPPSACVVKAVEKQQVSDSSMPNSNAPTTSPGGSSVASTSPNDDATGQQRRALQSKGISILKPLFDRDVELDQEFEVVNMTPDKKKPRNRKTPAKESLVKSDGIVGKNDPNSSKRPAYTIAQMLDEAKAKVNAEQASVKPGSQTVAAMISKESKVLSQPPIPNITPAKTAKSALAKSTPTSGLRPQTVSALADYEFPRNSSVHLSNFMQKSIHTPPLPNSAPHPIMAPSFCRNLTQSVQQVMKGALSPPLDPHPISLPIHQEKMPSSSPPAKVLNTLSSHAPSTGDTASGTPTSHRKSPVIIPSSSVLARMTKHTDSSVATAAALASVPSDVSKRSPSAVILPATSTALSLSTKSHQKSPVEINTSIQHSKVSTASCVVQHSVLVSPSETIVGKVSVSDTLVDKVSAADAVVSKGLASVNVGEGMSCSDMIGNMKVEDKVDSGIDSSSTDTPTSSDTSSVSSLPITDMHGSDHLSDGPTTEPNIVVKPSDAAPSSPNRVNEEPEGKLAVSNKKLIANVKSSSAVKGVSEVNMTPEVNPASLTQPLSDLKPELKQHEPKQSVSKSSNEAQQGSMATQVITLVGNRTSGPSTVLVLSEGMITRNRSSNSESKPEAQTDNQEVTYTPAKSTRSSHRSSTESQKSTDDAVTSIRPSRTRSGNSETRPEHSIEVSESVYTPAKSTRLSRRSSTESQKSVDEISAVSKPGRITRRHSRGSTESRSGSTESGKGKEESPKFGMTPRKRLKSDSSDILETRSTRSTETPSPTPSLRATRASTRSGRKRASPEVSPDMGPSLAKTATEVDKAAETIKMTRGSKRRLAMEDTTEEAIADKKIKADETCVENQENEEEIDGGGDGKGKRGGNKSSGKAGAKVGNTEEKGAVKGRKQSIGKDDAESGSRTTNTATAPNKSKSVRADLEATLEDHSYSGTGKRTKSRPPQAPVGTTRNSRSDDLPKEEIKVDEATAKKSQACVKGKGSEKRPKSPIQEDKPIVSGRSRSKHSQSLGEDKVTLAPAPPTDNQAEPTPKRSTRSTRNRGVSSAAVESVDLPPPPPSKRRRSSRDHR